MTRNCPPTLLPRYWQLRAIGRARLTRWLLLGSVLVMLGVQSALAAYACTLPPAAMGQGMAMDASAMDAAMAGNCSQMRHAPANRMLCARHCTAQAVAPTDARTLTVPPNLLTALPPMLPLVAMQTRSTREPVRRYRLHGPRPPANRLFCTLLI